MLNMARGHEELERKVAQTHELSQLMDKLSSAKIEMPLEDTHRPVGFDEPKKTHRKVGFLSSINQLATEDRGLTGWLSLEMVTSTRRFMARPETLPLSATGYSLP